MSKRIDSVSSPLHSDVARGERAQVLLALGATREADDLALALGQDGAHVEAVEDAPSALAALGGKRPWSIVIADPQQGGFELLTRALALDPSPSVILIASLGTIGDAVSAMRKGAFDYLARPTSAEHVRVAVKRALETQRLRRENGALRASLEERFSIGNLCTRDPRMRRVAEVIHAVADTRANVLITGESGTGKTLLARTIHAQSSRRERPFVVVDCGALPPSLLESELFGHARGAFTGAVRDKPGLFEVADKGTLFLDEIGNAPLELQAKLLRVIQDRVFERVGETRTREVDVRLIAATNRDLAREVAAGRFREDLFYRVQVVALEVPPLRERPRDVALLAELFLTRFAREHERQVISIEPDALALLAAAPWPGNVRQLENTIERAVLLCRSDRIAPADLGPEFQVDAALATAQSALHAAPLPAGPIGSLKAALAEPERAIIARALELNGGNRGRTAAMLGVNRTTLFNKMRKYDLLGTPAHVSGDSGHAPRGLAT
jgi:DNA-binding NtrC family response regulator